MEDILSDTGWRVERFIGAEEPTYFAVIRKKSLPGPDSVGSAGILAC